MADILEKLYGRVVSVGRATDGSTLTQDESIAATVLHVASTADFDVEDGGQVVIAGEVYDYLEVDEDASTITLDTGLLEAVDEDDLVELYDPEVEGVVVEYVALVLLDDQDPGDRPIEVTVQHGLVNMLSEGVRGGAAESVTLVRDGDDDFIIWQIDGKLAVDVVIEALQGGYGGTLQDIFDAADVAAAAAAAAAATATTAQTSANGKNKTTYSTSSPGSTANAAGDIWFRKDAATQTIIEQWQGQGGTSWQQVTLNDQVIANLDAGKLVAGSAFINGLSVKTNFTLGDAAVNGVIQSYNFAGSPVGVYIDKFGLVAKGGSIVGAEVLGGRLATGDTGKRAELSDTFNDLRFYDSSGTRRGTVDYINHVSGGDSLTLVGPGSNALRIHSSISQHIGDLNVQGALTASSFTPPGGYPWVGSATSALDMNSYGISEVGSLGMAGNIDMNSNAINEVDAINNGGGKISVGGTWQATTPASWVGAGGVAINMQADGDFVVATLPSLAEWKRDLTPIEVDPDALAALIGLSYRYREDVPFRVGDPDEVFHGYTYNQAEELGLDLLIGENPITGLPEARKENLPLLLLSAWQADRARFAAELAAERQERTEQIAALTARIEALEA